MEPDKPDYPTVPPRPGKPGQNPFPIPLDRKTKPVVIRVRRDAKGEPVELVIEPQIVSLNPDEQIAWTCPDGRLEIRVGRRVTPFGGDTFEVARGGVSFSGRPAARRPVMESHRYTVLVTTGDGFFLTKDSAVKVAGPVKE